MRRRSQFPLTKAVKTDSRSSPLQPKKKNEKK